jgi:hypothetical protein
MIEIVHHEAVHSLPVIFFHIKRFMSTETASEEVIPKLKALSSLLESSPLSPSDPNNFSVSPRFGVDLDECEAALKETFQMSEVKRIVTKHTSALKSEWVGDHVDYVALNKAVKEKGEYRSSVRITNQSQDPSAPSLVRLTYLGDIQIFRTSSGEEKHIKVAKTPVQPVYLRVPPGKSIDGTVVWFDNDRRIQMSREIVVEINAHDRDYEIVEAC